MPSSPEFPIPIADLDAGGREHKFPVRAAWLRGALEDTDATAAGKDGELEVRVSKSGTDVVVRGELTADLTVPCARCLDPVPVHLVHPVTALMVPASDLRAGGRGKDEADIDPEDLDVTPYTGDTIALDDLVRDELVLEIPMIPLCSEDCPGISPPPTRSGAPSQKASAEPAIDPRLTPLLRFKKISDKDKKE
jgi:uncharacterized protein